MTAALAVGAAWKLPFEDSLRLAAAAGALNVSRHGLGTGRRDAIEEIAARVDVRPARLHSSQRHHEEATVKELSVLARELDIPGRSKMTRDELLAAIEAAEG